MPLFQLARDDQASVLSGATMALGKVFSARDAVALIRDGSTIATGTTEATIKMVSSSIMKSDTEMSNMFQVFGIVIIS